MFQKKDQIKHRDRQGENKRKVKVSIPMQVVIATSRTWVLLLNNLGAKPNTRLGSTMGHGGRKAFAVVCVWGRPMGSLTMASPLVMPSTE